MRKLIFLITICIVFNGFANWFQIGQDIDGEVADDNSGNSVSLSADGSVVAIGAYGNDGNGNNSGHVRIYTLDNGTWVQIGQDIDGEAANDYSGGAVSLSADGTIVAIGAYNNDDNGNNSGHVRIYTLDNGTWVRTGQDIDGEAANDYSGEAVSLSADGTIVAIGAHGNENYLGHVRVYRLDNGTWVQIGQDIDGEAAVDNSGCAVSLSADGTVVAIGAYGNDSGHVRVYRLDNDTWVQIGQDIDGEAANDRSGTSVSLSADGLVVAIGAYNNDGNGNNSGHVRVYTLDNGTWVRTGQDIDGEAGSDYSGISVSLSADGTIVAITAPYNDGNGNSSGHVRIYTLDTGTWVQTGQDIDGEAAVDYSGGAVSLSADGTVVAIGAYGNDGNGNNSGHVRIYKSSLLMDSDGDGLTDYDEVNIYGTATNSVDTDGDGWSDYFEVNFTFSATNSDSITPSNDFIVARSELDALSNDVVTLIAETNQLRDSYLFYYDAYDQAQNEAEAVIFALQINSNQIAELTFTNNQLQEAMGTMLTSNDAHAMLDSAYVDDTVMIVSNNAASVIQVIEQSSNLTVGAWNEIKHITNTVPIDTDAAFFRFRLVE